MLKNLVQAREMVEAFGILAVAKTILPEQLEQLYQHEEEEYTRLNSGRKNSLTPGLDFEHCIIGMLGNPVITNVHKRLNSSWKSYMATINAVAFTPLKRHKDHMAIIHALESQNVSKLEKAIHQHHAQTTQALNALLAQLGDTPIDEGEE